MSMQLPRSPAKSLTDADLEILHGLLNEIGDAAGKVTRPHFRTALTVQNKLDGGDYDPVTEADQAAEMAIRELLARKRPRDAVYGEEHGFEPGDSGLTWVIDPIDGTRAFITGMPLWGTLVALYDGEKPVIGMMDQPYTGERFIGSRLGARLYTRSGSFALRTRACSNLSQAVLYCTTADMFGSPAEQSAFAELSSYARLTRFSGDCYAYCMLAHGLIDLVVEADLKPYDIAALIPIVEAAGGIVTNWRGEPAHDGGQVIAAGDANAHAQALEVLSQAAD
jgi:myo-inositol-1(or 4)-monophosphatase